MTTRLLAAFAAAAVLSACGSEPDTAETTGTDQADEMQVTDAELSGNPFRAEWTTPYGIPPFDAIADEHYMPAFRKGRSRTSRRNRRHRK